ncbi:phosphate ABC transporter substrate-binding protein PstS [Bosea sp. BK604]|uniref:phosphate ABC transporter substrate-binding protein PstS n=1 Tax=Bosea sp. BK604 TaxID=2512180 RepID=UPI0010F1207C|nr:phosphate ABC transporter substrate-binding protein PstS [Bosea sp. BK604]TCR62621.1 phosphate ABC transporter substrate-binding protein (PhoT family) [Bosea sp. BK604]
MKLLAKLAVAGALLASSVAPGQAEPITGAGSSFAFPVIGKWAQNYRVVKSDGAEMTPLDIGVDYEPIGSLGGEVRVTQRAAEFGASDRPLSSEELQRSALIQFPIVMGGIVPVVNIDGISAGQIKFTGALLADIYLGKIKTWSDPAIKAVNPDLKLPDASINVIYRADGSGTTFNWTDFLAKASPEWREKIGVNTQVAWPAGAGAERTQGVTEAVKRIKNSIGYIEFGQVVRAALAYGLVQNKAGTFVKPEPATFAAAAASAEWAKAKDFSLLLTDAPGKDAYPIVATTFALVPKPHSRRTQEVLDFFRISFEGGAADATALGYVPLPESLVKQVKDYWASSMKAGS